MTKLRVAVASVLMLALATGFVLQAGFIRDVKRGDTTSPVQNVGLAERVPTKLNGWVVRDEPLGPTEFLQSAVEQNLNYDDVVNRVYERGNISVGVYVAYWSPERMPVQKVASHTPDRCWTENGWTCEEYARWGDGSLVSGLLPAQWRVFTPPTSSMLTHVMYWHLVGGELYDYGEGMNRSLGPIAWWKETLYYALKGSAEQYFIRLTSNRPFDEVWDDPGVQEIVRALAELGLAGETDTLKAENLKLGRISI